MLQESGEIGAPVSRLKDSRSSFGWISIFLHWSTAVLIIVIWLVGKNIDGGDADAIDRQRALHISLAVSSFLLFAFRIAWRARGGHPHVAGQSNRIHRIATLTHYTMLVVLAMMMLSGPMLAWSGGYDLRVFDWFVIPGPTMSESVGNIASVVHRYAANTLFVLILVHIGGALKHLMFHADDTIVRMLWPDSVECGKRQ